MDPLQVATAKNTLFKNIMRYAVRQGTNSQGMIDAEKIKNFVVGRVQGKLGTEDPSIISGTKDYVSLASVLREYDLFNDFENLPTLISMTFALLSISISARSLS